MSNPGSGWNRLKDVYYRSREISQHSDQNLKELLQSLSPSLVTISDIYKTLAIYSSNDSTIIILNSNFKLISKIQQIPNVKQLYWWNDDLIVILNNSIRIYTNYINPNFEQFDIIVHSIKINHEFLIILDHLNQFHYLHSTNLSNNNNSNNNINLQLGDKQDGILQNWEIMTIHPFKKFKLFKNFNGLLNDKIQGIYKFLKISSNNQFIALLNLENQLSIYTVDLEKKLLELSINEDQLLQDLNWCGSDSIVLQYQDSIRLIAPGGDTIIYFNSNIINTINSSHGTIILTENSLELINKVSDPLINVFKIGSVSNSSILFNSFELLQTHNPVAFANLKFISPNIIDCINDCLFVALDEFEPYWQKKLIKAVNLGKSYLQENNDDINFKIELVLQKLKILNQLRSLGIFINSDELSSSIKLINLINLLNKRLLFKLSFKICQLLKFPKLIYKIFQDWCDLKIKSIELTDDEIFEIISQKFYKFDVITRQDLKLQPILELTFKESRFKLFEKLIPLETNLELKCQNYFKIDKFDKIFSTLSKHSQDLDLISKQLIFLQTNLTYPIFLKNLNKFPQLINIYESIILIHDDDKLKFYHQNDQFIKYIKLKIFKNMNNSNIEDIYKESLKIFIKEDDQIFLSRQINLLKFQHKLINELQISSEILFGLSIIETLQKLIELNLSNQIVKFSKEFSIPQDQLNYYKISYLIHQENYEELNKILNSSSILKLPLNPKFLLNIKQPKLLLNFLQIYKIDYESKLNKLIELKQFKPAIDECFKENDFETLEKIIQIDSNQSLELTNYYQDLQKNGLNNRFTTNRLKFNIFN
ncbi:hypothetical protein WICMUC_000208 [Wickerhamomyces mucosus]|uniref:Probable vacuolar protein sorting-associated protein 16 homolog n=1 Tax=Wickerhamomyces mucosus TaxID=1378264 RepID=A0A9P8PYG5_9ASCO|nr:hypothetical protein WICMUC_000208 [Wickerhamomyces mucosus]